MKSRITKRITNVKRHTTGYVIDGKERSVSQAVKMARQNQVYGVRVVSNHLQTPPGSRRKLLDLPVRVQN